MQKKTPKINIQKKTPTKSVEKAGWDPVAEWYDNYLSGVDTLQAKVIAPNILRMLDLKKGEEVLDLACGQGYFSELFVKSGAHITGVDTSNELIKLARTRKNGKTDINFVAASATDTKQKTAQFDVVVCILSLENIKPIDAVFAEVKRVLTQKGRVILVMLHPAFRIPQNSDWGFDIQKNSQYRRIDKYLSEISIDIKQNPFKQSGEKNNAITTTFHRSLQWYMKIFKKNGFAISAMEEWISHKKSQIGPRQEIEDMARKEFPVFLTLELKKV